MPATAGTTPGAPGGAGRCRGTSRGRSEGWEEPAPRRRSRGAVPVQGKGRWCRPLLSLLQLPHDVGVASELVGRRVVPDPPVATGCMDGRLNGVVDFVL